MVQPTAVEFAVTLAQTAFRVWNRLSACLICVVLVSCPLGCGQESPPSPVSPSATTRPATRDLPTPIERPSHVRMLGVLAKVVEADRGNPWTGTETLNLKLAELQSAQAAGNLRLAMILSVESAQEFTQQGDPDKALRQHRGS